MNRASVKNYIFAAHELVSRVIGVRIVRIVRIVRMVSMVSMVGLVRLVRLVGF